MYKWVGWGSFLIVCFGITLVFWQRLFRYRCAALFRRLFEDSNHQVHSLSFCNCSASTERELCLLYVSMLGCQRTLLTWKVHMDKHTFSKALVPPFSSRNRWGYLGNLVAATHKRVGRGKTVYYIVMYCIILFHIVVYCAALYCILLYCAILYCFVLHCTSFYYISIFFALLYFVCTLLLYTWLFFTLLYFTLPCFTLLYFVF